MSMPADVYLGRLGTRLKTRPGILQLSAHELNPPLHDGSAAVAGPTHHVSADLPAT